MKALQAIVFDFDGVFTDNRVWVNERGEESLAFSRSDGLGLRRLDEVGVRYLIVSMEKNAIVDARARKLERSVVGDLHPMRAEQWRKVPPMTFAEADRRARIGEFVERVAALRAADEQIFAEAAHHAVGRCDRYRFIAKRKCRAHERG